MAKRGSMPRLNSINSWRSDLEDWDLLNGLMSAVDLPNSIANTYSLKDLPAEIDFRHVIRIENQFSIGSCQGNSLSTSLEIVIYLDTGEVIQLSRMAPYIWTQELDGLDGDVGSTVGNGCKVGLKGLCLESLWKYPRSYERNPPNGGSRQAAEAGRLYRFKKYYRMKTPDDVMIWLESNQGPLHIGIDWVSSMRSAGAYVETYSGTSAGGHSITLAGYKTVKGTRCPRLYNSHSEQYGDNGTTVVSRRALDTMFERRNTIMIGVAQAEGIVAPRYDYIKKPVTR